MMLSGDTVCSLAVLSPGQSPICHTSGLVRLSLVVPCPCEMIWPDVALFSSHSRSVNTAITVSVPGHNGLASGQVKKRSRIAVSSQYLLIHPNREDVNFAV